MFVPLEACENRHTVAAQKIAIEFIYLKDIAGLVPQGRKTTCFGVASGVFASTYDVFLSC